MSSQREIEEKFFRIKALTNLKDRDVLVIFCKKYRGIYPTELAHFTGKTRDHFKDRDKKVIQRTSSYPDFFVEYLMERIAIKELKKLGKSNSSIATFLSIPIQRVLFSEV